MRIHQALITIAVTIASLLNGTVAPAQERRRPPAPLPGTFGQHPPGSPRGRGPDANGPPVPIFSLLSSEMRFGEKTVKGMPFSAEAIIESSQTFANGTHINRKATSLIYRDSEGRTRREQTLDIVGPLAPAGEAMQMIFINDPVAGTHYVLDPQKRTARKMKLSSYGPPPPPPPLAEDVKMESLGTQTIEGVVAEGTRSTVTVAAGLVGNDRPFDIVSERWDAVELQTVVLSKHSDPRMGGHVYRLTNIKRDEPARSLFEIPADYKIEEGRRPRRRPGRHRF
jgi:hypothetical protein